MFVKICGTTSEEDALLAVAMGADAVGFIFAPSPRRVTPSVARDIASRLPPEVLTVGVFRDDTPEHVVTVVNGIGLGAAQLHGAETAAQSRWVAERVPMVIKAFAGGARRLADAREYGASVVMVDSPSPGSGQVFDWRLTDGVPPGCKLLLAGGLDAANVAEAIAQTRPWGVDVVTGVESSPGHKDPTRLRAFVTAAKAAALPTYQSDADAPFDQDER